MKVKAILCVLSIFILFGCMHLFEGTINRHMNEEQKRQFEQNREMVRLVIKNSTSPTVYCAPVAALGIIEQVASRFKVEEVIFIG